MDNPTVILTIGLSGSGKSYWAKEYIKQHSNTKIVCKDDLRLMLDNGKYSKGNENFVLKIRDAIILAAIEESKNIIVADTNLAPKHEERIRQLVKDKATVEIKSFLDVSIETCIKQDLQRLNSVGKDVILKQYYDFVCKPVSRKIDSNKANCILVDLDGTLALNNHGRSYFDCSTCDKDDVCNEVLDVLNRYSNDCTIIYLTGREQKYEEPTRTFLINNKAPNGLLLMRATGDSRKDYVIKEELYYQHIEPYYNVKFVLDDRPSVIRNCWNKLGLFVFKVGREYEF
jgi:predicted kinase